MDQKLQILFKYVDSGFKIFPLQWMEGDRCSCPLGETCYNPAKHPRTSNGVLDAVGERKVVKDWHGVWPKANWGLATGKSSGVIVLDVDAGKGGFDSLRSLTVPLTAVVATGGGGRHYYFMHPNFEVKNSAGKLGPGLDIRGHNGYVILPPSVHPSGNPYRWLATPRQVGGIAEVPDSLAKKLQEANNTKVKADSNGFIPEGARHSMLVSLAGFMRRRKLNMASVEAALIAVNEVASESPLPQEEIDQILRSVKQW